MKIINKETLFEKLNYKEMLTLQKEGLIKHFKKELNQPPVGLLSLPDGSLHLKYAHIKNDPIFVVKLATGFPKNAKKELPTSDGCFLIFCSKTGILTHILHDEGYLTDCRTVLVSCLILENLLKEIPKKVGILGAGRIAKHQAIALNKTLGIKNFVFLGRRQKALDNISRDLKTKENISAETFLYSKEAIPYLAKECPVIITTTPSREAILPYNPQFSNHTIIAVGADEEGKQELDPLFLQKADSLVCDDKIQSLAYGEFQYLKKPKKKVYEIGELLAQENLDLKEDSLNVFDLTGMGIQDVQAVKSFII